MSWLKIEKFKKRTIEENIPDQEWTQVISNPTSIASLLITIDSLEAGQSLTITKLETEK